MTIVTITTRAYRHALSTLIKCPKCGELMSVFNVTNKRGKHWGTSAECLNGCKDEDELTYSVFSYDIDDLIVKIEKIKN